MSDTPLDRALSAALDRVLELEGENERLLGGFDLVAHLERQRAFSNRTFGPGNRTAGICDHMRKELIEVEAAPHDLSEWVDLILLALDGAWRAGYEPKAITAAISAKQIKNEARVWPDWRTQPDGKAIEHDRSDAALAEQGGGE